MSITEDELKELKIDIAEAVISRCEVDLSSRAPCVNILGLNPNIEEMLEKIKTRICDICPLSGSCRMLNAEKRRDLIVKWLKKNKVTQLEFEF